MRRSMSFKSFGFPTLCALLLMAPVSVWGGEGPEGPAIAYSKLVGHADYMHEGIKALKKPAPSTTAGIVYDDSAWAWATKGYEDPVPATKEISNDCLRDHREKLSALALHRTFLRERAKEAELGAFGLAQTLTDSNFIRIREHVRSYSCRDDGHVPSYSCTEEMYIIQVLNGPLSELNVPGDLAIRTSETVGGVKKGVALFEVGNPNGDGYSVDFSTLPRWRDDKLRVIRETIGAQRMAHEERAFEKAIADGLPETCVPSQYALAKAHRTLTALYQKMKVPGATAAVSSERTLKLSPAYSAELARAAVAEVTASAAPRAE